MKTFPKNVIKYIVLYYQSYWREKFYKEYFQNILPCNMKSTGKKATSGVSDHRNTIWRVTDWKVRGFITSSKVRNFLDIISVPVYPVGNDGFYQILSRIIK